MKTRSEQIAEVVKMLARGDLEFALIIYPQAPQTQPFFISSDRPPLGVARARDEIERCAGLDQTMVVSAKDPH